MSKQFNTEEIAILRSNPHVIAVSSDRVSFSESFKKMAYEQMLAGKKLKDIFAENGIDPDILGKYRIANITKRIRTQAEREGGFADLRIKNKRQPPKGTKEQTLEARVEELEHELAYTRQEVEFLKKIHVADLEARKSWESKHLQK